MEIQEKHRIEILNAKCKYVCLLDGIKNKSNYGEDIDCCANKLFLAAKLINRLECYCFDDLPLVENDVNAVFEFTDSNVSYPAGTFVAVTINRLQVYNTTTDDTYNLKAILLAVLASSGITATSTAGSPFTITATAFTDTLTLSVGIDNAGRLDVYTFENTVEGRSSTSNCHNCIEDSDLDTMYELLDNLLA